MAKTVLVMGASGQFGNQAALAFAAAGWTVRKFQRGSDVTVAAQGVQVVVNAMNPLNYHDWANIIPAITAQGIAAARVSGATLMVPGSVYVYGDQPGPWNAQTPWRPASRKGAIRVQSETDYRASGLRVVILRGGDFIEPHSPRSFWNSIALKSVAKGRVVNPAAPGVTRAYAYLPDMARAMVALAERRDTLPAFADIPFGGFAVRMEDVARALERLTGRTMKVVPFYWWLIRALSPFWELARELSEMRYLWNTSHSLDPAPLAALLPDFRYTSLDDVLREELAMLAPELLTPQGSMISAQTGR